MSGVCHENDKQGMDALRFYKQSYFNSTEYCNIISNKTEFKTTFL